MSLATNCIPDRFASHGCRPLGTATQGIILGFIILFDVDCPGDLFWRLCVQQKFPLVIECTDPMKLHSALLPSLYKAVSRRVSAQLMQISLAEKVRKPPQKETHSQANLYTQIKKTRQNMCKSVPHLGMNQIEKCHITTQPVEVCLPPKPSSVNYPIYPPSGSWHTQTNVHEMTISDQPKPSDQNKRWGLLRWSRKNLRDQNTKTNSLKTLLCDHFFSSLLSSPQ